MRALAMGEIGLGRTRSYKDFHRWATHVTDSLRKAGVNAFDLRKEIGERPEYFKKVKHLAIGGKVKFNGDCRYSDVYKAGGDNALVDKDVFKKDTVDTAPQGYTFSDVYGKTIKTPENMGDVREQVVADYQDQLEKQWVAALRKKHKVVVDKQVLATVNNH